MLTGEQRKQILNAMAEMSLVQTELDDEIKQIVKLQTEAERNKDRLSKAAACLYTVLEPDPASGSVPR